MADMNSSDLFMYQPPTKFNIPPSLNKTAKKKVNHTFIIAVVSLFYINTEK